MQYSPFDKLPSTVVYQQGGHVIQYPGETQTVRCTFVNVDTTFSSPDAKFVTHISNASSTDLTGLFCNKCRTISTETFDNRKVEAVSRMWNTSTLSATGFYTVPLEKELRQIQSVHVVNVEIPLQFTNVSPEIGNYYFSVYEHYTHTESDNTTTVSTTLHNIQIPCVNYASVAAIVTAINDKLEEAGLHLVMTCNGDSHTVDITVDNVSVYDAYIYVVGFAVSLAGDDDVVNAPSKLGWMLGFREGHYELVAGDTVYAEALPTLQLRKYLYLVLEDELGVGSSSDSFCLPRLQKGSSNIIAKISLPSDQILEFGGIFLASHEKGTLVSEKRVYNSGVSWTKIKTKLMDAFGNVVYLNGGNFSFCLEVQHVT